jgi:hypothetical protein
METAESKDIKGTSKAAGLICVIAPLSIVILLGSMVEGTTLYAKFVSWVINPASGLFGILFAWYGWRSLRAKNYMYKDRDGDEVQDEPYVAVFRAVLLAAMMTACFWWGLQSVLHFAIQFMPGDPVNFTTTVSGLGTSRSCRTSIDYTDEVTLSKANVCVAFAPGKRWIGEPVTIYVSAGALGTTLKQVAFDDVPPAGK